MREPMREPTPGPEPFERREERNEYRETPRPVREVLFHADTIRWSAIFAGTVVAIGIMVVLAVLGALIGIGAGAAPGGPAAVDPTTAGIYGAISMIIALFFGGWLAARTSATVGGMSGIVDGSLVWATILVIALFLTGFGVSAALGFVFSNFNAFGVAALSVENLAGPATWTLIGLIVSYAAAALGGWFGANQEEEVYRG